MKWLSLHISSAQLKLRSPMQVLLPLLKCWIPIFKKFDQRLLEDELETTILPL